MSLIGNILPVSHIVLDLEVSSKKRLFEEAGLLLENESGLSRAAVFECLFAREKLGTSIAGVCAAGAGKRFRRASGSALCLGHQAF